ncbi:MAG TPA: NB-ARC domain-containing protein [Actinophytocola sp.]|jgi:WD40 repeat protein|nr:NB-ARC domain-containing protein [Actinophytocola sp.]
MGGAAGGMNESETLVFVNYRSSDGASSAQLVHEKMKIRFGEEAVFLDHESLHLGRDFEPELLARLRGCAVLLVVVGDRWLDGDIDGPPIDRPDDWVRREILEAWEHDIPVVPVLFPGARLDADRLPPELTGLTTVQNHEVHRLQGSDIEELGERLARQIPRLAKRQANRQARPCMAPRLPANFVERPRLGEELTAALRSETNQSGVATPVVVTGAGGFGKTSLAAWACRQMDVLNRFADGVLWVKLGQEPSEEHLVTMLADLSARLTGERPSYETVQVAADAFAAVLDEQRLLLVVDDVWHKSDVEPFLTGGPRCVRLVTTRRPPVVAGHEIRVDAMSTSEAAALLRQGLPDATTDELAPLLERSGRWPLALSLLGGTLRSLHQRHGMTASDAVDALAADLGQYRIDELTDSGDERTIEATLNLSLKGLAADFDPAAVDRYVSLAAFGSGELVPRRLLERLWRMSKVRVQHECDRFFDRCLVASADAGGVRLHDVIRDEMRRRFPDRGKETSRELLNACRPPDGWHALPRGDELWPRLAYHLIQAGGGAELAELLRDLRFLVARLDHGGPLALESDLRAYQATHPGDAYAHSLAAILRQEAHLLIGHWTVGDLALTLHSRLFSRPEVFCDIGHVEEALPERGLVAAHPLPDRPDPRLVRSLAGHRWGVASLAWLPDGRLASVGRYDGTLRQWDTSTGEQESVLAISTDPRLGARVEARLSPDRQHLAVVQEHKERKELKVYVVDVPTGAVVAEWPAVHPWSSPLNVCWGPDSATLAIAHRATVELWRPFDRGRSRTLDLRQYSTAGAVAWHPRAGLACLAGPAGSLLWWPDPASTDSEEPWDLHLGSWPATALAWRPDGDRLAVADQSRLLLIEPARRRVAWEGVAPPQAAGPRALAWRPDGTAVVGVWSAHEKGLVTVWDEQWEQSPDPTVVIESHGHAVGFKDVAWHPSGEFFAVATSESAIRIWRSASTDTPAATRFGASPAVVWQPGGKRLAVVAENGVLTVVPTDAPGTVAWTRAHNDAQTVTGKYDHYFVTVVWSPDGRFLAHDSCSNRAEDTDEAEPIRIRDAETGEIVRELPAKAGHETRIIGWPTPRRLMTYTSDGIVSLIDAKNGEEEASVDVSRAGRGGHSFSTSADGSLVAVQRPDAGVDVIEMPTGTRTGLEDTTAYWDTCFLPDTAHLVGSRLGGELRLWDIPARKVVARTQWDVAYRVAADPVGAYVAAISGPGKIALFDARTLERVCQLVVDGTAIRCAFDSTGERLAVAGSAGLYLFRVRRGQHCP